MIHEIEIGKEYVDTATGYKGRCVSVHYYEFHVTRVTLETFKDGEIKSETIDAPRLVAAE